MSPRETPPAPCRVAAAARDHARRTTGTGSRPSGDVPPADGARRLREGARPRAMQHGVAHATRHQARAPSWPIPRDAAGRARADANGRHLDHVCLRANIIRNIFANILNITSENHCMVISAACHGAVRLPSGLRPPCPGRSASSRLTCACQPAGAVARRDLAAGRSFAPPSSSMAHTTRHLSPLPDPLGARADRPKRACPRGPARQAKARLSPRRRLERVGAEAVRGADFSGSAQSVRERPGERGIALTPRGAIADGFATGQIRLASPLRPGFGRASATPSCSVSMATPPASPLTRNQSLSQFSRVNTPAPPPAIAPLRRRPRPARGPALPGPGPSAP